MSEEISRVYVLEKRMDDLGETVDRVDAKLDGIAATLSSLARIEERQLHSNEKAVSMVSLTNDHENRLRMLERNMPDNLESRINRVESIMPGLQESRKWIVSGIVAIIGIVGLSLLKLVMISSVI
jgi:hypothetical protein